MTDGRPDPDQLLDRIKEEELRAARGKLKIFFGASAGVGKTYAMLSAARQQVRRARTWSSASSKPTAARRPKRWSKDWSSCRSRTSPTATSP